MNPITTDIPKIFFSDYLGTPFQRCIQCECDLLIEEKPYLIEKALKPYGSYDAYSTLFEYAVCMRCAEGMKSMLSKESLANLMHYFSTHTDHVGYRQELASMGDFDPIKWIEKCMISGRDVSELTECQIYAFCAGDQLVFSEFPYMISGPVLDEVVDLISAETKDELDRFKDEFVDGPSEFQDLLKSGPKVFI
ncbi:hypothetical protein N6H18_13980 [Reichenbachiella agarivorans]|uniref:Uncharacterized protein n=1 Tax=Reichenbachiella agarivorans TaxID=2979464 RepID=A0ABY6CM57_9BACT|nr:hypothetical protein [Reichenbachiella agarivorans]UXP31459.1 hypothetical protein N6H18_13980 [Reichenbachiella agarivorans]